MRCICVVGLGYVGLPVAVAFARHFPGTIAFDTNSSKVERLRRGEDRTGTVASAALQQAQVLWTGDPRALDAADLYIIAVPTPIDAERRPDLSALRSAVRTVGAALGQGDIVVLESTVYPGVTEEVCGPILEEVSGMRAGVDFHLGYSPERINPGDGAHTLERLRKVVAADDEATLEILEACYGTVVEAGVHRAPSIQVAEAAKVIENIQRDLNVALINELSMLFDRLGIDMRAVQEVAGSKWNFHRYQPGLVGGHCIGVDPYYLTAKAETVGFTPRVILAGRRINDGMGSYLAGRTLELLREQAEAGGRAFDRRGRRATRVAVLGMTFKPNVGDLRNSQVPGVIRELRAAGLELLVHDPLVQADEAAEELGLELVARSALTDLNAVLLAVPHAPLIPLALELVGEGTELVIDPMWGLDPAELPEHVRYWSL